MGDAKDNVRNSLGQSTEIDVPIDAETKIVSDSLPAQTKMYSDMTPDEIMQHSYAVLATVSHNRPLHDQVIEAIKEGWRVVGPIAFVVFTAGEVYYYLHHFMVGADTSLTTQILLWGVTLIIELPFMVATYELAGRRKKIAEAKERGVPVHLRDTAGAVAAWVVMAVVNVTGQVAFLGFITNALGSVNPAPLYFFIFIRVLGVLLGDAFTAFYLSPAPTTIALAVEHEKAQSDGITMLNDAAMERKRKESQTRLELARNERTIERDMDDGNLLRDMRRLQAQQMLETQRELLRKAKSTKRIEGPTSGDL